MEIEKALRKVVASSVATGVRKPGEFCWFNMITPQPAQACEFFGALLGWTFTEEPGMHGYIVKVGGRNVGGARRAGSSRAPRGHKAKQSTNKFDSSRLPRIALKNSGSEKGTKLVLHNCAKQRTT